VATSAPPAATPVLDHFKNKDRECHSCGAEWVAHEEKETDVSIGITSGGWIDFRFVRG
jgi:hypothetical protein